MLQFVDCSQPRDIFRYDFGGEKDTPVGKAITFFNHISRWSVVLPIPSHAHSDSYGRTSTVILSHPKPKYRARVYEKFRLITHSLRRLHNYDALYAMISGMQETSVHRLTQTHALLLPSVSSREYQSHLKLFGPRGGYAQYRKTIQEDLDHNGSAIPLLTSIIGLVNRLQSTRPEDVREDGSIQWDKYNRFAEILSVIPNSQIRGPPVQGSVSSIFKRVIDDTPIIESEDVSPHREPCRAVVLTLDVGAL